MSNTTTTTLTRKSRAAYATMGDPSTRYEQVYFQVDVCVGGEYIGFGFVDDAFNQEEVDCAVRGVLQRANTPAEVIESMHSRFD